MYEITRMPSYINLGNQGEAEVKTIEMVIRDLNNESVSLDQSIARGMREIKESY